MLTKAEKMKIIAQKIVTAAGRAELAGSMTQPLRNFRDYTGVGRRALLVDELPQGIEAYYDKDPDVTAFVVGEEGEDYLDIQRGERVHVPLFELTALPQIPITQIRQRRFDINARVKEKVLSQIVRKEDDKIFGILEHVGTSGAGNPVITIPAANVTIETLSDAIGLIEQWGDIKAANIFMNAVNNTLLRSINKDYYIDFEDSRELIKQGFIGTLYGCQIQNTPAVPKDTIIVTGEPEFVGRFVQSIDLTVLNYDRPDKRTVGFSVFEQVGVLVHNPKAVAVIKLT